MANEVGKRLGLVGSAFTLTALSALGLVAVHLSRVTGIGLVLVSVGIPMLVVCLPLLRRFADYHRRWAARQLRHRADPGVVCARARRQCADPAVGRRRRIRRCAATCVWLLVNSTVGLALYIVAIVESLLGLVFWWMPQAASPST